MINKLLSQEEDLYPNSYSQSKMILNTLWNDWQQQQQLAELPEQRFQQLIQMFYQDFGFHGDWCSAYHVESLVMHKVLDSRCGNAFSLAVVLKFFAKKFDLSCEVLDFSAQGLLEFTIEERRFYFDPFLGSEVDIHTLRLLHRGHLGDLARLHLADLKPLKPKKMIKRWLADLKAAALRQKSFELALLVADKILKYSPTDAFEVRDRGFIYHHLNCNSAAIDDFNFFIEHHPEDPISLLLKVQIKSMDQDPLTLH